MSTIVVNDIRPRTDESATYDLCRAWSKFEQTHINSSFNISSLIDAGSENYRISFNNHLLNQHYSFTEGNETIIPNKYTTNGVHFDIPGFKGYGNITVHGKIK